MAGAGEAGETGAAMIPSGVSPGCRRRWLMMALRFALVTSLGHGFGLARDVRLGVASTEKRAAGATDPGLWEVGRIVFEQNCAVCHGASGDGRGMASMMLRTKPRDFRPGIFKFRSTPTGSLPTDEDLLQTISRGFRGTGMVAQDDLGEGERRAAIQYLKTFSERFREEKPGAPITIPEPPPGTPDLVFKGKALYQKAECFTCHGTEGRGDGPSAADLKDQRGYPILAADLTRPLKRGSTPEAIYRTLVTGLDGTPMPSYEDVLTDGDLWALSYYVASLNTGVLSEQQRREEAAGQMVLRMHGGRGGGMMRRMPMRDLGTTG